MHNILGGAFLYFSVCSYITRFQEAPLWDSLPKCNLSSARTVSSGTSTSPRPSPRLWSSPAARSSSGSWRTRTACCSAAAKEDLHARAEPLEYFRIEISNRVYGKPARSNEMPRMQYGRGKTALARLLQKVRFDRRLAATVISKRLTRRVLSGRNEDTMALYPNPSAIHTTPYAH